MHNLVIIILIIGMNPGKNGINLMISMSPRLSKRNIFLKKHLVEIIKIQGRHTASFI